MKKFLGFIVLSVLVSNGSSNWSLHARFHKFAEYFPKLMQELVYEMENHGWWNFRLNDQTVNINQLIYDRNFQGPVTYNNGFLVSVQAINLTASSQRFLVDSTFTTTGSMVATLRMIDVVVGYDVSADFGELGVHKMTGVFNHGNIDFSIQVSQNLNTSEITTSARLSNLAAGSGNIMTYLPDTDIGEVLSRHYLPSSTWDGIALWGTEFMTTTLREIINRIGFPEVCFNCE